jgi:hypothetical protein
VTRSSISPEVLQNYGSPSRRSPLHGAVLRLFLQMDRLKFSGNYSIPRALSSHGRTRRDRVWRPTFGMGATVRTSGIKRRLPHDHALNAAAQRAGASAPPRVTSRSVCQGVFTDNPNSSTQARRGAMSDVRWDDPSEYGERDHDDGRCATSVTATITIRATA